MPWRKSRFASRQTPSTFLPCFLQRHLFSGIFADALSDFHPAEARAAHGASAFGKALADGELRGCCGVLRQQFVVELIWTAARHPRNPVFRSALDFSPLPKRLESKRAKLMPCGAWEVRPADVWRVSRACASLQTVCPNRGRVAPKGCPLCVTISGSASVAFTVGRLSSGGRCVKLASRIYRGSTGTEWLGQFSMTPAGFDHSSGVHQAPPIPLSSIGWRRELPDL